MSPAEIARSELDLTRYIRPGDVVVWGQACGEPPTLTARLVEQATELAPLTVFNGLPATATLTPDNAAGLRVVSYTAANANRALAAAGRLDIAATHYSNLPTMFARTGTLPADVVLIQVPPPGPDGTYRLGLGDEYLSAAIASARVVIAEVNESAPRTNSRFRLRPEDVTATVSTWQQPAELPHRPPHPAEVAIAELVADLVEDGATLQVGIGTVPDAILRALRGHRRLGLHSGMFSDGVAELMACGAMTNEAKSSDTGVAVAGVLMGTERLFRFVDDNPDVLLCSTGHTHDPAVLATQPGFVAINSALEVDLSGQVNTETVGETYVGAVGGVLDFIRGAHRSARGLPIIALPSTAGQRSRIVARLNGPATVPRADAGIVVTEHGVADLRDRTLAQRRELMLAVADPDHHDALAAG